MMTDKEDRRAQALRANLRRRKTWQRSQKDTVTTDQAEQDSTPKPSPDAHKGS